VVATKDAQVRKLMEELSKNGTLEVAAARAGMDPKTARKYRDAGKYPSEMKKPRNWRTREDPFEEDWPELAARLKDAPTLEAKTLLEELMARKPAKYEPGQLRTLQRRVRDWRAKHGPEKEVFFAQQHRPGEAMQTDFTSGVELGITIGGEPFDHLLCHPMLPYSNWEWATVCQSESMMAIKRGVQEAAFQLGKLPRHHQTDNSTAATHRLGNGKREFNDDYLALMRHLGMEPRTIEVGKKEQNGDVESMNGSLKRRLKQHLLVRGSRDFESVQAYEAWVQEVVTKANRLRCEKVEEELRVMRPLKVARLPEYTEEEALVTAWSTIRVKHNTYSVPSRLIGEQVRVRAYEDRLEVFHRGQAQLTVARLLGRGGHSVNYRHVIWSLVRKPGAFERYRYREDLFPTVAFRRAYDSLHQQHPGRKADLEYLRILHLSASTVEADVEAALLRLLGEDGGVVSADQVKAVVAPAQPAVPEVGMEKVDLSVYDSLLEGEEVAS
jgi:transposase InsO family protein